MTKLSSTEQMCGAKHDVYGYVCSREPGHPDAHMASGGWATISWKDS